MTELPQNMNPLFNDEAQSLVWKSVTILSRA